MIEIVLFHPFAVLIEFGLRVRCAFARATLLVRGRRTRQLLLPLRRLGKIAVSQRRFVVLTLISAIFRLHWLAHGVHEALYSGLLLRLLSPGIRELIHNGATFVSVGRVTALVEQPLWPDSFATRESATGGQVETGLTAKVGRHIARIWNTPAAFLASGLVLSVQLSMLTCWEILEALPLRRREGELFTWRTRCLDLVAQVPLALPKRPLGHATDKYLQLVD